MLKNFEAHLKNHEYPAYERYKASELANYQSSYTRRPSITNGELITHSYLILRQSFRYFFLLLL